MPTGYIIKGQSITMHRQIKGDTNNDEEKEAGK